MIPFRALERLCVPTQTHHHGRRMRRRSTPDGCFAWFVVVLLLIALGLSQLAGC